ncbi:unnamed protein product [Rotaria sordida]|uniref:NAD(P)(+)--arginine ADP-ribosyltransferase n=1 Tax=Rotaria sordida TaxID=392033 RepID=A0A820AQ68_9BILA|nr:unnamed protein product [Rotaria sordida]
MPLVSLEEATQPLIPHVPEIEHMVYIVQGNNIKPQDDLTVDESSSIALYSMEWTPRKNSFYIFLNETLRNANREEMLPPWFKFLKLLLTALSKLPPTGPRTIYRGVKLDLRQKYKEGMRIVWWGFSSCTTTVEVLENDACFGKSGTRTLFAIECDTGKNICHCSFYEKKDEILLLPGREFEVVSSMDMGHQMSMIQLKEVEPRFPNIASLTLSKSPKSIVTKTTDRNPKPAAAAAAPKAASQPKPPVEPVKISYESKNITDADIKRIIQEAIVQQQCTELNLSNNKITHEGAAILAKELRNNTVTNFLLSIYCQKYPEEISISFGKKTNEE